MRIARLVHMKSEGFKDILHNDFQNLLWNFVLNNIFNYLIDSIEESI